MKTRQQLLRFALGATFTLGASVASAYPLDLKIRQIGAPTCTSPFFQAEIKITNTSDGLLNSSTAFAEFAFNAGENEIEAVYPQLYATIFAANGAFVTWTTASVGPSPWAVDSVLSSDRKANQAFRVLFGPPRANPPNVIPPGGYMTVPVLFRRAGGQAPFDLDCDDFSKLDESASGFYDDEFVHLIFTSTQQLICEQHAGGQSDPLSGISFFAPFNNACVR